MWLLYIAAGFMVSYGLSSLLPEPRDDNQRARMLRITFGFQQTKSQANRLGLNFNVQQYVALIVIAAAAGAGVAYLTDNMLFVAVGVAAGFFTPKLWFSTLEHRRRREIIANLPVNLRLLTSKFRDSGSLQRSLERSLDLMHGVTKPYFYKLYGSLELGVDPKIALDQLRSEIRYRRFDDVCEKILSGMKDGFHKRSVDIIRESIKEMQEDTQLLKTLDINNKAKVLMMYIVVGACWIFPVMFTYLESQSVTGQVPTIYTPIGKTIIASMAVASFLTILAKNKYLQLNFKNLE